MKLSFYLNVPAAVNAFTGTQSRQTVNVTPIRTQPSVIIAVRRVIRLRTADVH